MKLEDFDVFLILPFLLVPFLALFFTLRRFGIGFLNIWFVWLSWFVTSLAVFIGTVILNAETQILFGLPMGVIIILFLAVELAATFGAIAIVTRVLLARALASELPSIGNGGMINSAKAIPSAVRIALLATIVMTTSMVGTFSGLKAAGAIFDHFYPSEYQIYNI